MTTSRSLRSLHLLLFTLLLTLGLPNPIQAQSKAAAPAQQAKTQTQDIQTIKVFWVGNSYTASGPLPTLVKSMIDEGRTNIRIEIAHHWVGGYKWSDHITETTVLKKIKEGKYDFVVLQDNSYAPTQLQKEMRAFSKVLSETVKFYGATPIFYGTWAKKHHPEQADTAISMYEEVASANDSILAPCGRAWKIAIDSFDEHKIKLHRLDNSHPLATGTYLSACVFYEVFTGQSPVGLALRTSKPYGFGKKNIEKYSKIDPNINNDPQTHSDSTALKLQQIAHQAILHYTNNPDNKIKVNVTLPTPKKAKAKK